MKYFRIKKELASQEKIEACARQFGVVGDQTRLKICYLLCKHPELAVTEIAELVGASVSTVSHSLRRLLDTGIVWRRREARNAYYSLKQTDFGKLLRQHLT